MSSLLGVSFVGAFLVVGSSFILPYLRRVITPTVSGIVVLMIGLSLIKVGIIDFGGDVCCQKQRYLRQLRHLGVGLLVLIVVIGFNCCRSPLLRMGGIAIGLCVGYIASLCLGMVDFSSMRNLPLITIPHPFKYGFSLASISSWWLARFICLACWKQSAISPPRQWFPAAPFRGRVSVPTERRRAGRWSGFCYRLRCRFITINHVCAK
ncbi:solute carrier family 23 protein [Escherichia coli]